MVTKLSEIFLEMFIPDIGSCFLLSRTRISDPGVKKAKELDPESATMIVNTGTVGQLFVVCMAQDYPVCDV